MQNYPIHLAKLTNVDTLLHVRIVNLKIDQDLKINQKLTWHLKK